MTEPTDDSRSCSVPEPDGVPVPVEAVTVQTEPDPVTPVTAGDPDNPEATSEKFPVATPVTASLSVTVQLTEAALEGEGAARLIEETDGAVLSIVQLYDVAELDCEPDTAFTRNVCEAADNGPEYDVLLGFVVPQSVNDDPSSEHWNFVIDPVSVYVNDAEVWFVGLAGNDVIVGAAGGDGAASAMNAEKPATASTPSKAATTAALLAALL